MKNSYIDDDLSSVSDDRNKHSIAKKFGLSTNSINPFEELEKQIQTEYNLAWRHQKPKKDIAEIRLKLFNNQMRAKETVGDTTMFTIFQTVFASLYVDRLNVEWEGKENGDEGIEENLNALSRSDYTEMSKDIADYFWIWNTCFFGYGLLAMEDFIRDTQKNIFLPVPRVVDNIAFLHDPSGTSINGDPLGGGACRDYGYEVKMTRDQMEGNPHIFDDLDFRSIKHGSGTQSLLASAMRARDNAQGRGNVQMLLRESNLGANAQYDVTEWSTHMKIKNQIKKVKVWSVNDRARVIGIKVLRTDYWPLVYRSLYPTAHDFEGTSIPDLTEDKQRARATAQNLGLKLLKADMYPMYIYDSNKITNRKDLKFNFNKFIPVDSKGQSIADALLPVNKARPNLQLLDFIYNSLAISAEKATATPDIQQGTQSQADRPLGETNLINDNVTTRYSLSAKVFGWSEKAFWSTHWYGMYKEYFKENIDEKVLRLVGAFGPKWRPLTKESFTSRLDPDVSIVSSILARSEDIEKRQLLGNYFALVLQDPTVNRKWAYRKLGKLNGLQSDELNLLFPPSIDELEAEVENDKLNKNETVPVLREQNHRSHNEIHGKANATESTKAHIASHNEAMLIRRTSPDLFPEQQATDQVNQMPADMQGIDGSKISGSTMN